MSQDQRSIAYFSMEIGLRSSIPTYSGGLGVLAGDTLKSMADLGQPVVAVSLMYHKGYFRQKLDKEGKQQEENVSWNPAATLKKLPVRVAVELEGKTVHVGAWEYSLDGVTGHTLPVLFLDTTDASNDPYHRTLTDSLYGGDERYRLCQEVVLGMGGIAVLNALGYRPAADTKSGSGIRSYHMNEGHAALLTMGLLNYRLVEDGARPLASATDADRRWVADRCVFTTHTPVPAGHDNFSEELTVSGLGRELTAVMKGFEAFHEGRLNMSHLALRFSRYTNGVAKRHGEVSRAMFPGENIRAITNGIHAVTWTADSMRKLFDQYVPEWRRDNFYLRYCCELPLKDLVTARQEAKIALAEAVRERTGSVLDPKIFTMGFARRAAEYKRGDMMFHDLDRLKDMARRHGGLQIIFAGKAHPRDFGGKAIIERVVKGAQALESSAVKVVVLENYDMDLGRLITTGVDIWLNNPLKPLEASGTSGMKAALNGVPNLSTLDGWWVEGHVEGVTGWEIEDPADAYAKGAGSTAAMLSEAVGNMYRKLDQVIMPMYYKRPDEWAVVMRHSIALNGAHFNTHRMVMEYMGQAYQ